MLIRSSPPPPCMTLGNRIMTINREEVAEMDQDQGQEVNSPEKLLPASLIRLFWSLPLVQLHWLKNQLNSIVTSLMMKQSQILTEKLILDFTLQLSQIFACTSNPSGLAKKS